MPRKFEFGRIFEHYTNFHENFQLADHHKLPTLGLRYEYE